jgi:predicted nucleotidyltransferase
MMSSSAAGPTPYPYVNEVVRLLEESLRAVLGDYFTGLYLHGSLAGGDFDPGHSDIDFLVVTTQELPEKLITDLEMMHKRIWDSGLEWAIKLEGTYIPKDSLFRYNAADPPRPHINEGKFLFFRNETYWVISRYILRENGVVVTGPPIQPLIAPVSPDELRQAVVSGLIKAWTPRLDERDWLKPPGHQPYIAVTCCRVLYTLKHGTIKSKPVSARWALKTLDKQWHELIESAIAWHYGMPAGDIEKTLQMARYTLEKMKEYRG